LIQVNGFIMTVYIFGMLLFSIFWYSLLYYFFSIILVQELTTNL